MLNRQLFDVIVIGGGHAGAEAALASARLGANTLLLTHSIDMLGQMSCNPAIGGIGKSHLVKEIDALGGVMAKAIDKAGIQFRTLNSSKGPAVRSTRVQADRLLYKKSVKSTLFNQKNLSIFEQCVKDLILDKGVVTGVITTLGIVFNSMTVIITAGTFLSGKLHIGDNSYNGGRATESYSNTLSENLIHLLSKVGRMKTGTSPRIDKRTVNFNKMESQHSDENEYCEL